MEKSPEEILKQIEYDKETVLRWVELQERQRGASTVKLQSNSAGSLELIKTENKRSTGLKEAIIEYLSENPGYHDRRAITKAILPQFEASETLETLLAKVSNALTKDKGTENPIFQYETIGVKKKKYSLKRLP